MWVNRSRIITFVYVVVHAIHLDWHLLDVEVLPLVGCFISLRASEGDTQFDAAHIEPSVRAVGEHTLVLDVLRLGCIVVDDPQTAALVEGELPDAGQGGGQDDFLQAPVAVEGRRADALDAFGQVYPFHVGVCEGIVTDGGHGIDLSVLHHLGRDGPLRGVEPAVVGMVVGAVLLVRLVGEGGGLVHLVQHIVEAVDARVVLFDGERRPLRCRLVERPASVGHVELGSRRR